MYSWGKTATGQLGLGSRLEETSINSPCLVPTKFELEARDEGSSEECGPETVAAISSGDEHTVIVTSSGRVFSCGSNDYGQLGRDDKQSRFGIVKTLAPYTVRAVACGKHHTLALDDCGEVFSWGSESHGQCGHNLKAESQPQPKLVRDLGAETVAQISAGDRHSMVLTKGGKLFSWGDNSLGQLGLGKISGDQASTPQFIECLQALPIKQISCGANHTLIVSLSGAVYAWGSNSRGQLGLGDTQNRAVPTLIRSLKSQNVVSVCCGQDHTLCLTKDGGVFSFGAGSYGQLGHGSKKDEHLPRKIIELMGTEVSQIACGNRHSLAFVPSRGRLYAFGLGGSGQLGTSSNANALTPQIVHGPWVSPAGEPAAPKRVLDEIEGDQTQVVISVIGAGGDCSFAAVIEPSAEIRPVDQRDSDQFSQIEILNSDLVSQMCSYSSTDVVDLDFLERLEIIFGSPACLNGSFLTPHNAHYHCSLTNNGIDLPAWVEACKKIKTCSHETISDLVRTCITKWTLPKLMTTPPDVETLRIFVTLPLFPVFENPTLYSELQTPFSNALMQLSEPASTVYEKWISKQSAEYFKPLVLNFKAAVIQILKHRGKFSHNIWTSHLQSILIVLRILNRVNVMNQCIIGYEDFYITEINETINLMEVYVAWINAKRQSGPSIEFSICNFPFVFDSEAKTRLLQVDQSLQMHAAVVQATNQAIIQALLAPTSVDPAFQYLYLEVDRHNILEDAFIQIRQTMASDLRKPLRVKFRGEEAEDAGGVTKEFFLLLLRDLFDPKYGMFKVYEETQTLWFHPMCFEESMNFFLIGVLCGLAIYNFTIINVPFPLVLYKKLLDEVGPAGFGLDDLEGLSPQVAKGLKDLLDYTEPDIEDAFCLNFTLSEEAYGDVREIELKPDGANITVNQENKSEYVHLYCDYLLNKAVKNQYDAFHKGFHQVCGGRVLELFHARELMTLVAGSENYNWQELEDSAQYKDGYDKDHPTIVNFWSVFHELSDENKKKFLMFLTGADRVPILGLKSLQITIQKTNDDNFLPVAHTCFNLLDLPCYATREKLKFKLLQAIQCTEGFGLV